MTIGLLGHRACERESGAIRPGAGADAGDSESLQVADRGRAGDGEDADGAVDALDESRDHVEVDDAGDEDAVCARLEIGTAALDRALDPRRRVADLAEEDIGAGVENDRDARFLADRAHGRDLGGEALDREQIIAAVAEVLHVQPDCPDLDDTAGGGRGGLGLVAVAGLHVRRHR